MVWLLLVAWVVIAVTISPVCGRLLASRGAPAAPEMPSEEVPSVPAEAPGSRTL